MKTFNCVKRDRDGVCVGLRVNDYATATDPKTGTDEVIAPLANGFVHASISGGWGV